MTNLTVPMISGDSIRITVGPDESLYVLGANGTGKSTLLFRWARNLEEATFVAGNRSVIFNSAAVTLSPSEMNSRFDTAQFSRRQGQGRAEESLLNDADSLKILLAKLKSVGDHAYQEHFKAVRDNDATRQEAIQASLPITRVNAALSAAGLPLFLEWNSKSELVVSKVGVNAEYGIDKMSDGERAALILAANVILAEEDKLILLDEPERHLHRAISSPLIEFLRKDRADLSWIIATHDLSLARDDPTASVLLLYAYDGSQWTADLTPDLSGLDAEVAEAIYGAREKVLFVEGNEQSLDKPLYALFFPGVTILGAGSCRDVQNAVRGLRDVRSIHHMMPGGLIDADNRVNLAPLQKDGIAAISLYAVESIYYRSEVVTAVLEVSGSSAQLTDVLAEACTAISDDDLQRFSRDASYKAFRQAYFSKLPSADYFENFDGLSEIVPDRDFKSVATMRSELMLLRDQRRWDELVGQIKVKSSQASGKIANRLQYANKGAYELAARKVLKNRPDIVAHLRDLVPDPFEKSATNALRTESQGAELEIKIADH